MNRIYNLNKIYHFIAIHYTFLYSMSAGFGIIIAPICGFIVDFKASRGLLKFLFNSFKFFSSRLYAKNVESFNFTNIDLDRFCCSLYCLYVSINCCRCDNSNYCIIFTHTTCSWKSSIDCYSVKIQP